MLETQEVDFSNIRLVLVETSHPGNIGATARAMKNMGLSSLVLVSPKCFPDSKAIEMAAGADDILQNARIETCLEDAVADCQWVIGTSARLRTIPWPQLNPKTCAELVRSQPKTTQIAIVFGRERNGLENSELQRCQYHLHIPTNPVYPSLNLSQAVQVIAYELRMAVEKVLPMTTTEWASDAEMDRFYTHLEHMLLKIGFLNPKSPRQAMPRLKRLFNRVHLEKIELTMLRGIFKKIMEKH